MDEIKLTKDADALVCVLYKTYLQRRKDGKTKREARDMGSSATVHEQLLPKWQFEDVDDTCRELSCKGLIDCLYADDVAWEVSLSDDGICYMQKRFVNGLASVLPHLESLAAFIPL